MLLSIIVPMYNSSSYILKLLDSIYDQNNFDVAFEVVIVDDRSIDNSIQIVEEYTKLNNIDNLTLIKLDSNAGTAAARNRGILESSSTWIQFVDSDDTLASDYFKRISTKLSVDVDCYIYGFNMEYENATISYEPQGEIDQRMIGYRNSVVNKIYKRNIVDDFEVEYTFEDVIWLVKLMGKASYKCEVIDGLKYNVNRMNKDSKMVNFKQEEWKKMAIACIQASRSLNVYAREFVLETFVGTLFTSIYTLRNRVIVSLLALRYNYRYLPSVIRDGIRSKSKKRVSF